MQGQLSMVDGRRDAICRTVEIPRSCRKQQSAISHSQILRRKLRRSSLIDRKEIWISEYSIEEVTEIHAKLEIWSKSEKMVDNGGISEDGGGISGVPVAIPVE